MNTLVVFAAIGALVGHGLARILPHLHRRIDTAYFQNQQKSILWLLPLICAVAFMAISYLQTGLFATLLMSITVWLLLASCIDLVHFLLLDILTFPLLFAGLAAAYFGLTSLSWQTALFSAFLGFAMLFIPAFCFKKWRGYDGLGGGDIKLLAALAAWTSPLNIPFILLLACTLGLLYMWLLRSTQKIPFGPFISFAGWLALLYNPIIIPQWLIYY